MVSKEFPVWGPYGKKYMGLSRITEHEIAKGVRFDFTTLPAIFGTDARVPNTTVPCGCHPWHCAPDYSVITYRYDLEWKDKVYAEVSYVKLNDESTLVRTELVNNSELMQNCLVNYISSIEFADTSYCSLEKPEKCEYTDARDYVEYKYNTTRPWDEQNADGTRKGEFADNRFVGGFGLGDRANKWHLPAKKFSQFGGEKGDFVSYKINCKNNYKNAILVTRYRTSNVEYTLGQRVAADVTSGNKAASFQVCGKTMSLAPTDDLKLGFIELGEICEGEFSFALNSLGTGGAEFDFFIICEKEDFCKIKTEMKFYDFIPETETEVCENGGISKYRYNGVDGSFVLKTFNPNTRYRNIETGSLEDCMTARISNADETFDDVTESFTGSFSRKHSDDGFFHNAIVHTLFVEPNSNFIEYAVVSKGETDYLSTAEYEKIYSEKVKTLNIFSLNDEGKKYELSCEILKSTVLTNAVYPIYKYGDYIIHHTPGKRWDCLYTWDSGFIGLGMIDYAPQFAKYSLETYITDESNKDYAFLHHGSPVPVQMYLYLSMLCRNNDKEALLKLYPKMKRYYEFLAGRGNGSTTAKFNSGLTTTYDYFYSSSGMDDYPAQDEMIKREVRDTAAPVIASSQLVRCAKILKMAAHKLGLSNDISVYNGDIKRVTDALNKYSWDEAAGYYGYVLHDENYNPVEIMRSKTGENFNKGLDGIYPIIAGACDLNQKKKILSHLKNEKEMLSPYGISAVDMTAGYFKVNGYWNGNVWFPHQWFIWKTMLDLGETDFAFEIANRALNFWHREVDYSYYTFEMVNVVTGRGGWFHNFGGLSTPITMWANAYYKAGTFNAGLDVWVDRYSFGGDNKFFEAEISYYGENEKSTLIICMNDDKNTSYKVKLDGKEVPFKERFKGTIEVEAELEQVTSYRLQVTENRG